MEFKMSIYGILLLIAGIVALVAVFLSWTTGISFTGWDIFGMRSYPGAPWEVYVPLIVLILAIVAILFALCELLDIGLLDKMVKNIIVLVVGVLMVVLLLLFPDDLSKIGNAGIGYFLSLIAGILLILVPLLSMLKVLPE